MGRARRSTRSSYSYHRRAPYNLRSRSRARNYINDELNRTSSERSKPSPNLPKVAGLSLLKDDNAKLHHTDMYQLEEPVFRRGHQFKVTLELSRALGDGEAVHILLLTGREPFPSKGTLLTFSLLEDKSTKFGWQMVVEKADKVTYNLSFTSPAKAIIGLYEVGVQVSTSNESKTTVPRLRNKFYLIFNPWCEEDIVYMEDEAERNEYVMNETGRIWVGSRLSNYGKPWVFGQFEACALQVAKYILEISDLHDTALNNPVVVARTFSKMSNSFDDDGILQGNWSGDYSGGVEPTDWISSVDILREYQQTKKEVKYGQCWVFSALLTTLFRAVGIPARCVTNFESAHDNDSSMTIDRHWNSNYKPLTDLNDSIWNFHVWNEVWFNRHDLPQGYDGWQIVDGTPQERSEGVMQCGPAPLKAILNGDVYLPYDSKFVIAEVNGDVIEWVKEEKTGEMEPVWVEPRSIGFNISTKAVGRPDRNDITDLYKYREGSKQERDVVTRLATFSSRKEDLEKFYKLRLVESVKFDLSGTGKSSGEITILLQAQNTDSQEVTVDSTLTVVASYYTGASDDELKTSTKKMQVAADDSTSYYVTLAGNEYLNRIATDATITVFCQARVLETGQRFFRKESFAIDRPDLEVVAPSYVEKGKEFNVDVSFKNELSVPLTECRLIVGGPGIQQVKQIKPRIIDVDEAMEQRVVLQALSLGSKEIVCQLHTRQLQNITGCATIHVQLA